MSWFSSYSRLSRLVIYVLFGIAVIYWTVSIFISYNEMERSACTASINDLKKSHAEEKITLLTELRKQVQTKNQIIKTQNKKQRDELNLHASIERYQSDVKELNEKLHKAELLIASLSGSSDKGKPSEKEKSPNSNNDEKIFPQSVPKDSHQNPINQNNPPPPILNVNESKDKDKDNDKDKQSEKSKSVKNENNQTQSLNIDNVNEVQNAEKLIEDFKAKAKPLGANELKAENAPLGIPVIVFTASRAANLRRTLDSLISYRPSTGHPIFVSQDGANSEVTEVINSFVSNQVYHLRHTYERSPKFDVSQAHLEVYYKISQHFRWALTQMFDKYHYNSVIIMEDDMEIAPDFYSYFSAMDTLIDSDPTIYCASAWNDNGQKNNVADPNMLYRTDMFPGLGWLLRRSLWEEIGPSWPDGFWDDWMRLLPQRQGRSCIYPEINRVYTFGKEGASGGQFFDEFLASIKLNDVVVHWDDMDLLYLQYDRYTSLMSWISTNSTVAQNLEQALNMELSNPVALGPTSAVVPTQSHSNADESLAAGNNEKNKNALNGALAQNEKNLWFGPASAQRVHNVILFYDNLNTLNTYLDAAHLMVDHKDGIPRSSFHGFVPFRRSDRRIWLVPRSEDALNSLTLNKQAITNFRLPHVIDTKLKPIHT